MNAILSQKAPLFMDELNLSEQYRRQAELMYLKSYVAWLTMREKATLTGVKKPA